MRRQGTEETEERRQETGDRRQEPQTGDRGDRGDKTEETGDIDTEKTTLVGTAFKRKMEMRMWTSVWGTTQGTQTCQSARFGSLEGSRSAMDAGSIACDVSAFWLPPRLSSTAI
jgi:hypothetical protein